MKRFLAALLLLLLILAVALWSGRLESLARDVETVTPTRGQAVQAVYATGTVEATVMLPIAPRLAARLMTLNVDEGSQVGKDQVLAQLEDEDVQQSLKQLQAREAFAKREYDRAVMLVRNNAAPRESLERTRAELEAAQAATKAAQAQLGYLKLLSPAEGTIIRRDGEIGQLIPANQPVFWLSCCAPLRISAEVDEEDIPQVQPGQKVLIRADAFPGSVFNGKVESITPKGDPIARSYRVRITFTEDTPLMIGMTAETNIVLYEHANALLVPSSAIQSGHVWRVVDGKFTRTEVRVGAKGPEQTEILEGLTEQDRLIPRPDDTLKEGARAKYSPPSSSPESR